MTKDRDDQVKQSTICNTCRASGTVPRQRAKRETGPDGRPVMVTVTVDETCPTCKGFGEYPLL